MFMKRARPLGDWFASQLQKARATIVLPVPGGPTKSAEPRRL
jgi:hypothetical protein